MTTFVGNGAPVAYGAKVSGCLICKREFTQLKFATDHIKICTRCVNTLNDFSEPAIHAQTRLGELLAKGMERNALRDLESAEDWKRNKARWTLDNFPAAYERALPGWLNRLLADKNNHTRDYKTLRAYRRGLLRLDGIGSWNYPSNWKEVATLTRSRGGYKCIACASTNVTLDVHHIIYLSNYGTNQQSNLVVLCRPCHEYEHGRTFDFGETEDPESPDPIRQKLAQSAPMETATKWVEKPSPQVSRHTPPLPPVCDKSDTKCPNCGGICKVIFGMSTGDVYRCTSCGSMPSHQGCSTQLAAHGPDEGLSEGAYATTHHTLYVALESVPDTRGQQNETSPQVAGAFQHGTVSSPPAEKKSGCLVSITAVLVGAVLTMLAVLLVRQL